MVASSSRRCRSGRAIRPNTSRRVAKAATSVTRRSASSSRIAVGPDVAPRPVWRRLAAERGGPGAVELGVGVDEARQGALDRDVHRVRLAQDGVGEDRRLGGTCRDRRVGGLCGGDGGGLGVAALREQRLGQAEPRGGVRRLRLERAPEPALGILRVAGLDVGASGQHPRRDLLRHQPVDLDRVDAAPDHGLDERQHGCDVVGVLAQAAAVAAPRSPRGRPARPGSRPGA